MKILFLHGWQSVPGGVKPTYLRDHGHEVINPKLDDDDFDAAVKTAQAEFDQHHPDVVVGSSRGGAVAININSGDAKLVLLCPAWKNWGAAKTVKAGTVILHSRADDVIPFTDSEELANISEAKLIEVGNDHRLAEPEPLEVMLEKCLALRPRLIGCDFGVPQRAGEQAKKIILIEAVRLKERHYAIEASGRNSRLVHEFSPKSSWKERRRGWTLPDLANSLSDDSSVLSAAFDFPFSLPIELLQDDQFAQVIEQPTFQTRDRWTAFVAENLSLEFEEDSAYAILTGLSFFKNWRNKQFWRKRATDDSTNGSPPLKHMFQNVFAMTIAGNALLHSLEVHGYSTVLQSNKYLSPRCIIETYPRAVANRVGFDGSYKASPQECLETALHYLTGRGIKIDFDPRVRHFCETYRTSGNDPDGADAFLCLVAAIAFTEGFAELCDGEADLSRLKEEGAIIVPCRSEG